MKNLVLNTNSFFFFYKLLNLKQKLFKTILFQKQTFKFFFFFFKKYQRSIKKILNLFYQWKKIYLLLTDVLKINNVLIINKFFYNQKDIYFAINNHFVFKNRKILKNNSIFLYYYDLLEITIFKDMYFYNNFFFFFYLKFFFKRIKITKTNFPILDTFFFKNFNKFVKNIFEIDFYTFSCFVIKTNFFSFLLKLKLFFLGFNFKYYKWKKLL